MDRQRLPALGEGRRLRKDTDLIAAFIAKHGVTRCPAAAAAETSAELPRESREALRARAPKVTLTPLEKMNPVEFRTGAGGYRPEAVAGSQRYWAEVRAGHRKRNQRKS